MQVIIYTIIYVGPGTMYGEAACVVAGLPADGCYQD